MDYGVLVGSVEETKKNGKRKGEVRKCIPTYLYRRKSYPAGRPLACVVVDLDVQYFQCTNKVERGVELKFSPVGC